MDPQISRALTNEKISQFYRSYIWVGEVPHSVMGLKKWKIADHSALSNSHYMFVIFVSVGIFVHIL